MARKLLLQSGKFLKEDEIWEDAGGQKLRLIVPAYIGQEFEILDLIQGEMRTVLAERKDGGGQVGDMMEPDEIADFS